MISQIFSVPPGSVNCKCTVFLHKVFLFSQYTIHVYSIHYERRCYKEIFSDALKNHHSHDVLLVCLRCHTLSNLYDQTLRDQLVKQCDAPLADGKYNKVSQFVIVWMCSRHSGLWCNIVLINLPFSLSCINVFFKVNFLG